MAAASRLRFSPLSNTSIPKSHPFPAIKVKSFSYPLRSTNPNLSQSLSIDNGDNNNNNNGGGGFGKGSGGNGGDDSNSSSGGGGGGLNPIAAFFEGWRSRVAADPDFPFKVLMEELVGVSATAAGDMATRPNFGLGELDFVLSTLVVGSIVNFTLMYLLAPTLAPTSSTSLPSYIFEPGPFPLSARLATLFYKGLIFAAVGFASGLAGTAVSNGLVAMRKKEKEAKKKKGPKTVLNAATWAVHMGVSSNLRYQTLNAVEFVMAKAMPVGVFKATVVVLRCLNNVAGGMSFVLLGRFMGSQKVENEEEEEVVKVE